MSEKLWITRRLYELGYGKDEILMLYAFIDWVMALPEDLAIVYHETIRDWEAEIMRYVTTAKRIGMEQGVKQGKRFEQKAMTCVKREPMAWANKTTKVLMDLNVRLFCKLRLFNGRT